MDNENVFIVDADKPPQKPYTYQEFPRRMHHPSGDTKRNKVAQDEAGMRALLEQGFLLQPVPQQEPEESEDGGGISGSQFEELDERLADLEAWKSEVDAFIEALRAHATTETPQAAGRGKK